MQTITLRNAPDVARVVRAAYGGYKKHNAFLSVFPESGKNINSYWDGGSRSTYVVVELTSGRIHPLPTQTHPYFDIDRNGLANIQDTDISVDHVGNVTLKHLPEGFALVQGGTFCGKTATAHVYVNPANMSKLLETEK